MGKSKKVTIGYKYYMGIHAGLARGPVDEIVEIRVGDKKHGQAALLTMLKSTLISQNCSVAKKKKAASRERWRF